MTDPTPEPQRLQKILANSGVASRRASEDLISGGRVTVNGQTATLGQKVQAETDDIRVDGERVIVDVSMVYVLLNKPQGVVTTADDPQGRITVVDMVEVAARVFPVGRLDIDTEGLLLLTNDGDLTHKLLHPSYEVERSYLALIKGKVRRHVLAQIRDGVELEDGIAKPKRIRVLEDHSDNTLLEIVMTEGRKREVRRMIAEVGLNLDRLARTTYAGVELGELRQGKWRHLTHTEVSMLHASVAGGRKPPAKRKVDLHERKAKQRGGRETNW
ncbi:MAG: 23S rRNA pseudouridine2605 synthase [Nitriliruptoraceae bacterium]